jgi:hypothetical protein
MSIYDDAQKIATDVLGKFNQGGLTYVKVTPGAGPAANPGPPTEQRFTLIGVSRGVQFRFIDGTLITAADFQCTIPVDTRFVPDDKGFIETADGARYKVRAAHKIPPTGVTVSHRLIYGR